MTRAITLVLGALCLTCGLPAPARATPVLENGWPVQTGFSVSQSGVAGQLDQDPELEVAIASQDGSLYVFNHDGTWVAGFPQYMGSALGPDDWVNQCSSPAICDLDANQVPEIVVGCFDGRMYVFEPDGSLFPGFPFTAGWMIFSTPAIGDIDGDGAPEIVFGSNDGGIYALNPDGSICAGFPVWTPYVVRSSPALGDLDHDGAAEIAIGADNNDYHLYVLDGDGSHLPGFPKNFGIGALSSPSIADLDADGDLEIAVGARDGFLHVMHHDGSYLPGWPVDAGYSLQSSPTLVNLAGGPELEIIVGLNDSKVSVYNIQATLLPGWPQSTAYTVVTSASVADIDADDQLEIITGDNTGLVYGWNVDGSAAEGFPLSAPTYTIYSSALLADLDTDDQLEMLIGCNDTWIYCWDFGPGSYRPDAMPWPQWRYDNCKTAAVPTGGASIRTPGPAPIALRLEPFAPNPFPESTSCRFHLSRAAATTVRVLDHGGRVVRTLYAGHLAAGGGMLNWRGEDDAGRLLPDGVYLVQFIAGRQAAASRVILIR